MHKQEVVHEATKEDFSHTKDRALTISHEEEWAYRSIGSECNSTFVAKTRRLTLPVA